MPCHPERRRDGGKTNSVSNLPSRRSRSFAQANNHERSKNDENTSCFRKGLINEFCCPPIEKVTFHLVSQQDSKRDPASGYALALLARFGASCGRLSSPKVRLRREGNLGMLPVFQPIAPPLRMTRKPFVLFLII